MTPDDAERASLRAVTNIHLSLARARLKNSTVLPLERERCVVVTLALVDARRPRGVVVCARRLREV